MRAATMALSGLDSPTAIITPPSSSSRRPSFSGSAAISRNSSAVYSLHEPPSPFPLFSSVNLIIPADLPSIPLQQFEHVVQTVHYIWRDAFEIAVMPMREIGHGDARHAGGHCRARAVLAVF